jgi:hypothetical protein
LESLSLQLLADHTVLGRLRASNINPVVFLFIPYPGASIMTDKADPPLPVPVEQIPSIASGISAIASANAPFIYFDGAPNFGFNGGIANITIEAIRFNPVAGTTRVLADRVIVAHLRMGLDALRSLKGAIEGIELLAQPVPEGEKN